MRPLTLDEIWELEGYETHREAFRRAIIEHKRRRRLPLGDRATLVFENHATLLFQVQEMLRVERLRDPAAIQHELDVYNELMPADDALSATLYIEITDRDSIRPELDRLIGLDEHLSMRLGDREVAATFDPKQMEEDRIAAVQYVRFPLDEDARARLADPATPVSVRVDHPNYRAEAEIPDALRESLLADLADRDEVTLPRPPAPPGPARDETIFEEGRVRAYRPARPRGPGHVVVEPLDLGPTFLDADPGLLAECQRALQRAAREITAEHGACRIETEAGSDAALRYHLLPR